MGPDGHWVEVQIRSRRMDEIAEKGFAAHWKYKQNRDHESELDKWIKRIKDLLEAPDSNALEFLDDFKLNLFTSEIYVFTPKGEARAIPVNSNALDFAYEIHSQIGHKAIGAKVNYKTVSLHHKLSSGDQVEIITSNKLQPRIEWLDKVHTAKAKQAIKAYLKSENADRIDKGKKILEEKLKPLKLIPSNRIFRKLIPNYEVSSKDELYSKIGMGIIQLDDLEKVLKKNTKNKWIKYWSLSLGNRADEEDLDDEIPDEIEDVAIEKPKKKKKDTILLTENTKSAELNYSIAKCCNAIPGDDVVAFMSEEGQVTIHKTNCSHAVELSSRMGHTIVPVKWSTHKIYSFLAKIGLSGTDRFGIYNEITTVITKQLNVNIRNINLESHDGIWNGTIELYVHSTSDLNNLIMSLSRIKGVSSVKRVETAPTR